MSIVETITAVPAEHEKNVFGQFDEHIKKIEKTFNVTVISRDGALKILGNETAAAKAKSVLTSSQSFQKGAILLHNRM